jgi:hypothetical protein
MASINIPKEVVPGFNVILQMKMTQIEEFGDFLSSLPIGLTLVKIQDFLENLLNKQDAKNVFRTLLSFRGLLDGSNPDDTRSIASDLVSSYIENPDFDTNKIEADSLTEKLFYLLKKSKNIFLTLKANDLATDDFMVFRNCKIITDIRIVFDDNIENSNRNALIVHKLHIVKYSSSEISDLFISMDMNDLEKMKETIDRAIAKEKTIINDYGSKITFINANQ